ncbi:hypothetical protein GOV14_05300 [Candidatus Pacearchaeota archaeon]|nr:hypothetical protein [Candidatus Pacearchaeota archaeon]
MKSRLIITPVENLQDQINSLVKSQKTKTGIYVSLNKTQKSIEQILKQENIATNKLFFIDCVASIKEKEDVLHIPPNDLNELIYAIKTFFKEISEEKYLIIDALSTFLIYNETNKVAEFINKITSLCIENNVELIALSPVTKGEELLNKIFNFFDQVKKPTKDATQKKTKDGQELIY